MTASSFAVYRLPDYVPPSIPWEMTEVITSLMTFALFLLRPGGRLVFFLPTEAAKYSDDDIPRIPSLRLIANSEQSFVTWSRRLITMEKVPDAALNALEGLDRGIARGEKAATEEPQHQPGHHDFRSRYQQGFR